MDAEEIDKHRAQELKALAWAAARQFGADYVLITMSAQNVLYCASVSNGEPRDEAMITGLSKGIAKALAPGNPHIQVDPVPSSGRRSPTPSDFN